MRVRDFRVFVSAVSITAIAVGLSACDKPAPEKGGPATPAAHEEHKAPHGGAILELGEEEAHVEVVHDPKAGVLTLYVYGKNLQTPVAVAAPVVSVAGKSGPEALKPVALDAQAGGTATSWKLTDPLLATDPLNGRLEVTIGGKTFRSPLEPAGHGG